jgi:hypothetical protein
MVSHLIQCAAVPVLHLCCGCCWLQVQCTGSVPTVSVDKCDGVQAYIPQRLAANPNFQVRGYTAVTLWRPAFSCKHNGAVLLLSANPNFQVSLCSS